MQCIEIVAQDHVVLRRALNILDAIVAALDRGQPVEFTDAQEIVKFIRLVGIECHQEMEEEHLFPTLRRAVPLDNRIRQMLFQHEEQRVVMVDIEEALDSRRRLDFVQQAQLLIALYRGHLDQEETILAQIAEAGLSATEDNALVSELTKNRKTPMEYTNFTRLGWKYLSNSQARTKTAQ
jgi:hemerythrin-like domain-containing protein